jgi:S-adenosylmethionine-dependent methyltransferase
VQANVPERTTSAVFDAHLDGWQEWQASPWGRLRYQLVAELLGRHLGNAQQSVVDLGGGDGADSIPLAVAGHRVVVADSSPGMLALAQRRAEEAGTALRTVVTDAVEPQGVPPDADVVLFHNVLQYCADPAAALATVVRAVRPGGLVSVLVTNPVNHVLRTVVRDLDPGAAVTMLDAEAFRTQTFEHTVRRITWQDARGVLELAGADVVARYGVLCVNHLVTDDERKHDPQFFADLARLELALADREPYRDIAAMWMLVARRHSLPEQ